jgi:hypothetical protein
MSNLEPLNRHQKKALVIEHYNQCKTRRQIAEIKRENGSWAYCTLFHGRSRSRYKL